MTAIARQVPPMPPEMAAAARHQAATRDASAALVRAENWMRNARSDIARGDLLDAADALTMTLRRIAAARDALRAVLPVAATEDP